MKGPYITHAEELLFEHFEYTSKEFQDCLRGVVTVGGVSSGGGMVGSGGYPSGTGGSRRVSRYGYEHQDMLMDGSLRASLKTPPTGNHPVASLSLCIYLHPTLTPLTDV